MQNHYNLIYREEEREMMPLCRAEGIASCRGVRWRAAFSPAIVSVVERMPRRAIRADGYGHSLYYADTDYDGRRCRRRGGRDQKGVLPIQVALAWILRQAAVSARSLSVTTARAARSARRRPGRRTGPMTKAAQVEAPYRPHAVPGP